MRPWNHLSGYVVCGPMGSRAEAGTVRRPASWSRQQVPGRVRKSRLDSRPAKGTANGIRWQNRLWGGGGKGAREERESGSRMTLVWPEPPKGDGMGCGRDPRGNMSAEGLWEQHQERQPSGRTHTGPEGQLFLEGLPRRGQGRCGVCRGRPSHAGEAPWAP